MWLKIQKPKQDQNIGNNLNLSEPSQTIDASISKLEQDGESKYLQETFNIDKSLDALCHVNRLCVDSSILNYWESKKKSEPELYQLSQVILAAPASQVSVERAFSALGLILTQKRTSIKSAKLNDVLIIKLNSNLLNGVNLIELDLDINADI